MPLRPSANTLLEKLAVDNGFDIERPQEGDWLSFRSGHAPLGIWLTVVDRDVIVAFSMANVVAALPTVGIRYVGALPHNAVGAVQVPTLPAAQDLIRRAFQLSRTLPDEPLHLFERAVAGLPRTTEAERLIVQRVGQNVFRDALIEYWQGRCAVTGLDVVALLRASHIKPWADCETDAERLNSFNGILLAPQLDAAFDRGYITFEDDGTLVVSDALSADARRLLALERAMRVGRFAAAHAAFLPWHRSKVFRNGR